MIVSSLGAMHNAVVQTVPDWLPENAISHVDFLNEQYYAGMTERVATDILARNFDENTIDANGYPIGTGTTAPADFTGSLLNDFSAQLVEGLTMVFTFRASSGWTGVILEAMDGSFLGGSTKFIEITGDASNIVIDDWDVVILSGGGGDLNATGVNKIAVTANRNIGGGDYEFACSINGGTVFSDTRTGATPLAGSVQTVMFCHAAGALGIEDRAQVLTLYPAVNNTVLQALSGA